MMLLEFLFFFFRCLRGIMFVLARLACDMLRSSRSRSSRRVVNAVAVAVGWLRSSVGTVPKSHTGPCNGYAG